MSHDISIATVQPQLLPLQRLADARRVLEIDLSGNPFAQPEDRHALRQAKRIAWAIIAEVAEDLVSTLNVAAGDADLEDDDPAEDDDADDTGNAEDEGLSGGALQYAARDNGAGCVIADPDAAVDDSCCDEPTMDLEPEDGI
jgi:hypothetical protein